MSDDLVRRAVSALWRLLALYADDEASFGARAAEKVASDDPLIMVAVRGEQVKRCRGDRLRRYPVVPTSRRGCAAVRRSPPHDSGRRAQAFRRFRDGTASPPKRDGPPMVAAAAGEWGVDVQLEVRKVTLKDIEPLRLLYLQEMNVQVRFNKCHDRGWSDVYLVTLNGVAIGYGAVKGLEELTDRDAIFELYLVPPHRSMLRTAFVHLVAASGVRHVECQSNDMLVTAMLYQFGRDIHADAILFADHAVTAWQKPDVQFRAFRDGDDVFDHAGEPSGDFVLDREGEIVATGGIVRSYNMPFADLYMEVKESHRRRGYGTFLVQELKRQCYQEGRLPAARCNVKNAASQATLLKAGLTMNGFVVRGVVSV